MVLLSKWSFQLIVILSMGLWAIMTAGCGKPARVGLHPDHPPVMRKGWSLLTEFVEVDTLMPTFRWQPLSIIADHPNGREPAKIDTVTYEIRIWQTTRRDGGKLVYRRATLTATEHRVERPLDPGTRYYWSVRAHVEIDGVDRTTEWSLAGYLLRNEAVPNDSCLRFRTPEEPEAIVETSEE